MHSARPHSPVGRAGLLHQGSVSGPLSREGSGLQQCWPAARGCPAVCGACSSALVPCVAEIAGLGLCGSVVEEESSNRQNIHRQLCEEDNIIMHLNLKSSHYPQLTGWVGLSHLRHLLPKLPNGLLLLLDHLRVSVTNTHSSNVMQAWTSTLQ